MEFLYDVSGTVSASVATRSVLHEGSGAVLVAGLAIGALEVLLAVVWVWQQLTIT